MHRFLLLFLMCMLSFGSYYVYDNPAALERTILNVSLWATKWERSHISLPSPLPPLR